MDNITGKWSFNRIESDYWNNDLFNTKEEAEQAAVGYAKENKLKKIAIGMCELVPLPDSIDVENILENLEEEYANDAGSEYEDYLYEGVKKEDRKWLEEKLNEILEEFHKRAGIKSTWYAVHNVRTIEVEQEEIDNDKTKSN